MKASIQIIIKKEYNNEPYFSLFLNNIIAYLDENSIPYTFFIEEEFNKENEVDVRFINESFIKYIDNLILKYNDVNIQLMIKDSFEVKHRLNSQKTDSHIKSWDEFKYYFNNLPI